MKTALIALLFCIPVSLIAQENNTDFDVRLGIGSSLLGNGDMHATSFETELNYLINNYLASSFSFGYGKSDKGVYEYASFFQSNLNIFVSPFRNNGINDFRIGGGLSRINVSDARLITAMYSNNELVYSEYQFDQRSSFGFNVIIENTLSFTDRFMMGVKFYTQKYALGDMNSGILLKCGVRF